MKTNKDKRDPNAPKRNLSAYLLYQNAMRDTFKAQNPTMKFGDLSRYTSSMYAGLTPQEKEAWQARAEADKTRYLMEMANYVPPVGYDARGDSISYPKHALAHAMVKKRYGKYTKDPNAPKRNLSAYLLYQNAMREQFKMDNPGMTFGQLSKYTSHMFKSLTPEEKAHWDSRAAADKERFDEEISKYKPPPGHDATGKLIDVAPTMKRMKKPRDPQAPKRARGSYVFFALEARPQIIKERPDIKFTEIGSVMGERWRAMKPEEKEKYQELAKEDKARVEREREEYYLRKAEAAAELAVDVSVAVDMAQMPSNGHMDAATQAYQNHVQMTNNGNYASNNGENHAVKGEYTEYPSNIASGNYLDPNQAYYDPTQYHYA